MRLKPRGIVSKRAYGKNNASERDYQFVPRPESLHIALISVTIRERNANPREGKRDRAEERGANKLQ